MSAELTRPHFSTKVYKCYLHYLRTHYPEIDLENLSRKAGLPLRHIEDENNWVSVVFDEAFTRGAVEECRNNRLSFEAGRQNATPAVLGTLVHLMVRFSLSLDLVYRTLPRFTSFFTRVTELKLLKQKDGIATYHFGPKDPDKLTDEELEALRRNYANVLQNTLGHYSGLPTVKSKLPALVTYRESGSLAGLPTYEIEINYGVSEHPLRKLTERSIPLTSLLVGLLTTVSFGAVHFPWGDALLLGSLTALSFLAIRGYLAQRGMGKNLENLARDYELLDRRYTGVQRTKERFSRLASRNRSYRHLFDELDVAIAVVQGPDFSQPRISIRNAAFARLSEKTSESFLSGYSETLRTCRFENRHQHLENRPFTLNESTCYFSIRMFPVGSKDVAVLVVDTTQSFLNARLMEAERDRAAHNSKLAALGQMAAGISHELNNPLSVVTLLCAQAEDSLKKGKVEATSVAIEKINRHLDRMAKIIQSVKRFARDGSTVQASTIPVSRLIEQAIEFCEGRLKKSDATVEMEIVPPEFTTQANEVDLVQVLVNLINNACDSVSKQDLRKIKISSRKEAGWTIIDVTDSGPGVSKENREQILNPFFTTKDVDQGTGLGLSLSANIMERHDGSLELLPNLPCTFRIKIPPNKSDIPLKTASQNS